MSIQYEYKVTNYLGIYLIMPAIYCVDLQNSEQNINLNDSNL